MAIVKWSAIGVTLLMALANVGQIAQDINLGWKILGVVLAFAALVAAIGVVTGKSWGVPAIIAVGSANLLGAIVAGFAGLDGWPIGVVLAALAVVSAAVYRPHARSAVAV